MMATSSLPALRIKGMRIPRPIIQGGMGIAVPLPPLARAAALAGGLRPEEPPYTVGTNAWRVDRILPVRELLAGLAEARPAQPRRP